jgi:hypothetical protein
MCGTIQRTLNKIKLGRIYRSHFIRLITVPVFKYGSKNLALNISERRKIETA